MSQQIKKSVKWVQKFPLVVLIAVILFSRNRAFKENVIFFENIDFDSGKYTSPALVEF